MTSTRGLLALVLALFISPAWAGAAAGLPWEAPLQLIAASLTGPIAFSISLISIVTAGGVLIFGGELNQFSRVVIFIVLVLAMLVAAANFLSTLFGTTGALIA
jgi:type IV secretory pathway VirB2 component (pilin)